MSSTVIVSGSTDIDYRLNTDGLQFFLDMVNPRSYPGIGERIYDLSPKTKDTSLDLTTYTGGSTPYFTTGDAFIDETISFNSSDLSTLTLTGSFEMVIKIPVNVNTGYYKLIFGYGGAGEYYNFGLLPGVSQLAFNTGNADIYGYIFNPFTFYDQWHYITCIMYNLRTGNIPNRINRMLSNQIWVDGVQQTVTNLGTGIPSYSGFYNNAGRIGSSPFYYSINDSNYNGIFDCALFRVYDRALTPEEISRNYRHLKPIYNLS